MIKRTAYINGKVFTVDENKKWAEAVVTYGDKIIFVGNNIDARKFINEDTKVIDLNNRLMLPGFIDSHAHIIMGGEFLLSVDLSQAKSANEFILLLKNHIVQKRGKWIKGGNWNHQNWDIKDLPSKEWIDEFSIDTPVFVSRADYHMALANSCALKLAGITKDTPDPVGGLIERSKLTGEPTGILKDKAMELVYNVIPDLSEEENEASITAAMNLAKSYGVTSIHDICYKNHFRALQNADNKGYLTCRVYARLPIDLHQHLIEAEIQKNFGSDKLKIGSVKAFADGALGASTAYFFEPYEDDNKNFGLAMDILIDGRLKEWMLQCDKHKLQLSVHAIGDRAISEILDIVEEMNKQNPKWDRRFRIEHAQHMRQSDFKRCAELNVIVSVQPYHLFDDGSWIVDKIGQERMLTTYAFNSFVKNNVKMCFGSDWSVATLNPLKGIYAAVTRHTCDNNNPDGLIPDEKITVEEAIKCYTINAAYSAFSEDKLGSICVGKFADMVVINRNIFEIDPNEIKGTEVDLTVFNGEIIFSK
ncbi:MAG: amidohydrolase [Ignavibacteriae bacterium HGW-Ignavibacteriae-2]|jgi:hypothetical protein|nr:MAG: amidohydrolase [Ignavibacteriae bacterium HGW-Ignavibacteriae-2]